MTITANIVFVDDDNEILDSIKVMLRKQTNFWNIEYFNDPLAALERIRHGDVDIVVSDMSMPGKSGLDLLHEIKKDEASKYSAVIILTGLNDRSLKREALAAGAADLLNKPIVLEDLLARLVNTLKMKRYEDDLRDSNLTLDNMVRVRTLQLEQSRIATVIHLAKAGEYRDEETGKHIIRVGSYARCICERLGMEKTDCDVVAVAAPLHDIGKIGIPDRILLNPGKLDAEEWKIMRTHTQIGYNILNTNLINMERLIPDMKWKDGDMFDYYPVINAASEIALNHHERLDGKGYPNGLRGTAIPRKAVIVAISDMYDALRSERPYKKGFSHQKAMEIIAEDTGHFDPEVCEAFFDLSDEISFLFDL